MFPGPQEHLFSVGASSLPVYEEALRSLPLRNASEGGRLAPLAPSVRADRVSGEEYLG